MGRRRWMDVRYSRGKETALEDVTACGKEGGDVRKASGFRMEDLQGRQTLTQEQWERDEDPITGHTETWT